MAGDLLGTAEEQGGDGLGPAGAQVVERRADHGRIVLAVDQDDGTLAHASPAGTGSSRSGAGVMGAENSGSNSRWYCSPVRGFQCAVSVEAPNGCLWWIRTWPPEYSRIEYVGLPWPRSLRVVQVPALAMYMCSRRHTCGT